MKKKWLSVILSAVLAVGMLAGCSGASEEAAADDSKPSEEAAAPA